MSPTSPSGRDRAQRRVRTITAGTAVAAGALTLVGAAVTAGTFSGRTVGTTSASQEAPTLDPADALQQPTQAPAAGSSTSDGGSLGTPIVSGGS